MSSRLTSGRGDARGRRRAANAIKESMRELSIQLSLLNHQVGAHLERGGWIARERDPSDRRAVLVRALRDRNPEVFRLYAGMNASMDQILAGYTASELEVLASLLRRTTDAGHAATNDLAAVTREVR
jgi:DNA-binding MarR family transcriptional regulator